ncbi:MAG: VWA domain-containing protein [Verrucomicrobiae bacterium]|nr:VWA domain-containing protein [Verrucomicrobiae bacterium]
MNDLFLRWAGTGLEPGGEVVGMQFGLHPAVGWGWFALLVGVAGAVAWGSYRRRDVELTPGRRRVLTGLRALALLAIAGVLLRPGLVLSVEGLVRQGLVLLVDQSASMALQDPRTEERDRLRAAMMDGRVSARGGWEQSIPPGEERRPARVEMVRAALTNRELALVERLGRGFEVRAAGFSGALEPLAGGEPEAGTQGTPRGAVTGEGLALQLRADGRETALGTALRELLEREQGRPLGAVVMFTDGIRNAGMDPRELAERMREAGVRIYPVGVGTTAPRDLQVVELGAPEVAFARDEVPVTVRVLGRGYAGQTTPVRLLLDGERVDERDVTFDGEGEVELTMRLAPESVGDFELAVELPVRADEILGENNREARRLRVVDDRVRVLLLDQSPRWEFRYLQALLLRDRRVTLKCVLFDGDPAIARGPDTPYLDGFPSRREELFEYDLVVFGDVDPRNFTASQLEMVAEFVSRTGGGFLMVAGRRFSPWSYRDTPIERLLPVEFDRPLVDHAGTALHERPVMLGMTAAGRASRFFRVSEDEEENERRWAALPSWYWVAPVGRAKPAAEVLLIDEGRSGPGAPAPVVARQQYGVGQTMFIGTDNVWRWRRNEGEAFYTAFWGRVVQRMSIQHLVSGSRRTQLALDRAAVTPGERVGVTARMYSSAFEPLTEDSVVARIERDGEDVRLISELVLRAVPDQAGLYQADLVAPGPGRYRLRLGDEAPAAVDFTVDERRIEAGETALQEGLLRELAEMTGGGFFREEDLHRLPDVVESGADRVRSRRGVDLWSSPLYYLAILGLLAVEWVLRKWWQLK